MCRRPTRQRKWEEGGSTRMSVGVWRRLYALCGHLRAVNAATDSLAAYMGGWGVDLTFRFFKVCCPLGDRVPRGGGGKPSIHPCCTSAPSAGVAGELMPLCERGQEWTKRGGGEKCMCVFVCTQIHRWPSSAVTHTHRHTHAHIHTPVSSHIKYH